MTDLEGQHVIESGAWSAWLDGELSPAERAQVEAHLCACTECRAAVASWQAVRAQLDTYAPPAEQAQPAAFWARLAPQLAPAPRPRPDPALYLAPAALMVAWLLCRGLAIAWAVVGPLGGWRVLEAVWRRLDAPVRWIVSLGPDWPAALAQTVGPVARWVGPGGLMALASQALVWTVAAALAAFYAGWIVLWLRRPAPARA